MAADLDELRKLDPTTRISSLGKLTQLEYSMRRGDSSDVRILQLM
jgi:hypothetical protein